MFFPKFLTQLKRLVCGPSSLNIHARHICRLRRSVCGGPAREMFYPSYPFLSGSKVTGRLGQSCMDVPQTFTTSSVSYEAIGSIQSKHYQLVYTCKVRQKNPLFFLSVPTAMGYCSFSLLLRQYQLLVIFYLLVAGLLHQINEENFQAGLS